jgi:hypothetical protein
MDRSWDGFRRSSLITFLKAVDAPQRFGTVCSHGTPHLPNVLFPLPLIASLYVMKFKDMLGFITLSRLCILLPLNPIFARTMH